MAQFEKNRKSISCHDCGNHGYAVWEEVSNPVYWNNPQTFDDIEGKFEIRDNSIYCLMCGIQIKNTAPEQG